MSDSDSIKDSQKPTTSGSLMRFHTYVLLELVLPLQKLFCSIIVVAVTIKNWMIMIHCYWYCVKRQWNKNTEKAVRNIVISGYLHRTQK
jgi:hypothetical protein